MNLVSCFVWFDFIVGEIDVDGVLKVLVDRGFLVKECFLDVLIGVVVVR